VAGRDAIFRARSQDVGGQARTPARIA